MLVHVGSFRGIFAVCCGYVVLLSLIVSQQLEVCSVSMDNDLLFVEGYLLVRYDWKQFSLQIRLFEVKCQKIA